MQVKRIIHSFGRGISGQDIYSYTYIIGETEDIKAIYKSICRNSKKIKSTFEEFPKFSEDRNIYAICIEEAKWGYYMYLLNSDTMLEALLEMWFQM